MPLKTQSIVPYHRPVIIGLTGGIGSGKTRVGYLFRRLKTPLIEADKIVHGLLGRRPVKKALQRLYGDKIFNKFKINHQELARISFANRKSVNRLNKLLHPLARKEIIRQITACRARAVAIDAALLMETGLSDICDFIVFVKANKSTRLKRVKASRNWPAAEVASRERFQMPTALKEQRADFIIDNNGSVRNTFKQVKEIIAKIVTNRTIG